MDDFERSITEPNASLTEQHQALMKTEGVTLTYQKDGIRRIAETAWEVNERTENIGARRLHTLLERLLEDVSFDAGNSDRDVVIDAAYVDARLGDLAKNEDLRDRKSTRLNSSHVAISYAVFCLKKKTKK